MKTIAVILSLFVIAQAYDFSELKPVTRGVPVNPKYTASEWEQIFANQRLKPEVYPGYKRGTVRAPATAGLAVHHDTRVVGGETATHGQFPWQVLIVMDESYVCGGSVISNNWVLTAGHCGSDFENFKVTFGAQRSNGQDPGSITKYTKEKIVHSDYNAERIDNDIALLHFTEAIEFTQYIQPARLPTYSMASNTLVDSTVTVSGWGKSSDASPGISQELRFVSMPVMSNDDCAKVYGDVISASKLCTNTAGGRSSCNGDSGGPLVLMMKDGKYTEVGIVSFGAAAGCEKEYPAAFTRVTSFLQWIESNSGIHIDP